MKQKLLSRCALYMGLYTFIYLWFHLCCCHGNSLGSLLLLLIEIICVFPIIAKFISTWIEIIRKIVNLRFLLKISYGCHGNWNFCGRHVKMNGSNELNTKSYPNIAKFQQFYCIIWKKTPTSCFPCGLWIFPLDLCLTTLKFWLLDHI